MRSRAAGTAYRTWSRLPDAERKRLCHAIADKIGAGEDFLGVRMSRHQGIGKIAFTGSAAAGKKVMSSASQTLKRLTLELGGNDAGIVLPDVDPKQIAEALFWVAFINNGQTCA
jgi:acyl-CoA reductase-like NAD-dependent aldehyde dehydrogenase